jgi:hypothetical protein
VVAMMNQLQGHWPAVIFITVAEALAFCFTTSFLNFFAMRFFFCGGYLIAHSKANQEL